MKYIKLYEFTSLEYQINKLSYVDLISEDDEYYTIQISSGWMSSNRLTINMASQLNWIFKNNYVNFYCENHLEYEEFKVRGTDLIKSKNKLVCYSFADFNPHIIDLNKPIKISKILIDADKYNL